MPTLFLRTDIQFSVADLKGSASTIARHFNNPVPDEGFGYIEFRLQPTVGGALCGLSLSKDNAVTGLGLLVATAVGESLTVECKGLFSVTPRPQYFSAFLDPTTVWCVDGITYSDPDGTPSSAHVSSTIMGLTPKTISEYNEYRKLTETATIFLVALRVAAKAMDLSVVP